MVKALSLPKEADSGLLPLEEEDDREGSPTPRPPRRQFDALPGTRLGQAEVIRKGLIKHAKHRLKRKKSVDLQGLGCITRTLWLVIFKQPRPQKRWGKGWFASAEGNNASNARPKELLSDEAWAPLQLDKQATAARDKHYHELLARQAELEAEHAGKQEEDEDEQRLRQEQRRQEGLQYRRATTEEAEAPRLTAEEDEAKRRLEQERVRYESERRKREEELVRLERERRAAEEERRKEAAA
ncbi:MAG: hypothetical protein L6R40_007514 [Gallowayella cf. fulva]|nr:MAG: hypothetical protein L6R40_007514 [Xanthomendoza cf. fulva]